MLIALDTRDGDEILPSLNFPRDHCDLCGAVVKLLTGDQEAWGSIL